VTLILIYI